MPTTTAWQRRVRRALMLTGTVTTVYLFFGYLFGRMRDARIRALKERREKEVIQAHFTSLLSTISFTLYALLPTLEPQLFATYPVEATSQALQNKSGAGAENSVGSPTDTGTTTTTDSTPADSLLLEHPGSGQSHATTDLGQDSALDDSIISGATTLSVPTVAESVVSVADSDATTSSSSGDQGQHPGESWASEFSAGMNERPDERRDDDMLTASTLSQSISLPPTDTSSAAPSPTSEVSALHSSPPRGQIHARAADPRSKKELWRDLKVQSLTRALSTAYLVPLIYLLTSSQLTILARTRYLADVKAGNLNRERERQERAAANTARSILGYFSVEAMGLSDYVDRGASAGASLLPKSVRTWFAGSPPAAPTDSLDIIAEREMQLEAQNAEAERVFLTYSWWLLHEGWRTISARVETAVEKVFAPLGLKRAISVETWDALVKEVRAQIETDLDDDEKVRLFDFTPLIVPPSPLPPTFEECPLPLSPEQYGEYLISLLAQTTEHVSSPDSRLIVDKGVSAMLQSLSDSLHESSPRRFADYLPELNRWSRGVWEGIPDGGVEALLALPEYEAFAALIFGDWAARS